MNSTGGYDATRDVLDDQDIMCRLYQVADFYLIDECLYLQRFHQRNTQRDNEINVRIQHETVTLYDRYVEPNVLAWANRRGLAALDLGAAHNKPGGYLGVDQYEGEASTSSAMSARASTFPTRASASSGLSTSSSMSRTRSPCSMRCTGFSPTGAWSCH